MSKVVQYVLGQSGWVRERIVRISGTGFRVDVEQRHAGTDAEGFNHGDYWATVNAWQSYADTIERALDIATEGIRNAEANV